MARRRPILRRLDLLCLGASPEKLAQQKDIPAILGPALTADESERLYILNYEHQFGGQPLAADKAIERDKLLRRLHARR